MHELSIFPTADTCFFIDGPAGQLETAVTVPGDKAHQITAIVCHPHPLQEGTMHNKVVTTLTRAFRDAGIPSVRFNFRGVGQSEGEFGKAVGELADLMAVVEWVKAVNPEDEFILAGFSFGSYIAAKGASLVQTRQLISIAPPVHHNDFASLIEKIHCPWLIVQGEADEVVPPEQVYQWVESFEEPPAFVRMADTGHFFHGKLIPLRDILRDALIL